MQNTVNCYTWRAGEKNGMMKLSDGITFRREGVNDTDLKWGDIEIAGNRQRILRHPAENVTLVFVETWAGVTSHNLNPQPHLQNSHTWIGAEGDALIWQRGEHRSHNKKQLFRLTPKESFLFIDAFKEVTKVTASECGTAPERVRATNEEVADHVLKEAQTRGKNKGALKWSYRVLLELDCQEQTGQFLEQFGDPIAAL